VCFFVFKFWICDSCIRSIRLRYYLIFVCLCEVSNMSGSSTSPRKSLSVREAGEGISCLHKKMEKDRYKPIANFYFTIEAFVKFPVAYRRFNGYILNVHRTDSNSM
jgi:hypothetical protein